MAERKESRIVGRKERSDVISNYCKHISAWQGVPRSVVNLQIPSRLWGLLIKWEGVVCDGGANRSYLLSDNIFWPVSLPEKEKVVKMPWPCGSPQWNDVICWWLPAFVVSFNWLWSFTIMSCPATLQSLLLPVWKSLCYNQDAILGVETFRIWY